MRRSTLLAVAAVLILTLWRLPGPAPKGTNAPAREFSAGRATALLQDLLREGVPHPVGSRANRVIRDRIIGRFRALGYQTEIQRAFVCNAGRTCATVENLIARPAGLVAQPVVLVAHYDSVPAGLGASDDGVALAVLLEIARAALGDPGLAFLITDGEEAGLLGAEAFVRDWPLRPGVVVNVENRGTSGPSYLFETSRGNRDLIRAARALPRPVTTSLFYTVYDRLPNDTDVSVFKRVGVPAVNFAAIGSVEWYHTPLDDLLHVNARTLQHHGDNALAMARALTSRAPASGPNANWFDLLGFLIVDWPERWTVWIALLGLVVVVGTERRRGRRTPDFMGILVFLAAIVLTVIVAYALVFVAYLGSDDANWLAYPQLIIAAMWCAGIACALVVSRWRQSDVVVGWFVGAILLALYLPGAAYLLLVPALLFAVTRLPVVWSAAAAMLIFPIAIVMYIALGKTGLIATAVFSAILSTTAAPLFNGSRRLIGTLAAVALACALITPLFPTYTPSKPKRESLTYELPKPAIDVTGQRNGNRVVITARSLRAADRVGITVPEGAVIERVNGTIPAPLNPRGVKRTNIALVYGREAVVEVLAPRRIEITARDFSYGVPPAVARRRGPAAVPFQRGDVTISTRKARY